MLSLVIVLSCMFTALSMGFLAARSDFNGFTIPNIYSVIIIAAFFVAYGVAYLSGNTHFFASFISHILAALIVFVLTYIMFYFKAIGGGDSKLATAFAFWIGIKGLFPFLFYMTFIGGIMGAVSLYLKKKHPFKAPKEGNWIHASQAGENKIPYGLAIMIGALVSFLILGYLSEDAFASFLMG